MIALYSLWNMGDADNAAGFNSVDDLMSTIKLSMLQSRKYFSRIVFVTDTIGAERAKEYSLPCTVVVAFDELDIKPTYWAFAKLIAMSMMKEPFAHIDNDFIFWQDPHLYISGFDFCFQTVEHFSMYRYYSETLDEIRQRSPALYTRIYDRHVAYAYNCGLVACNNIEVLDEWLERALCFIEEADTIAGFSSLKGCFNHLLEQYIIALIIHEQGLRANVLLTEFDRNTKLFTHLWGGTKRNDIHMQGVKRKISSIASLN
jgi:hypothetical protein